MPSAAKQTFADNSLDVKELWKIRQGLKGSGVADAINVMNRSAVIFITACWESYIEDLAFEAFDFLLKNSTSAIQIPSKVRAMATRDIWSQKDATKVWDIADTGWRTVLQSHRNSIRQHWLGDFNTPKSMQVNNLYKDVLGIPRLSAGWSWQRMSFSNAEVKLDKFIGIRGDIAHRLKHKDAVYQHWSKSYLGHIERIVDCCEASVASHINQAVGMKPW